MKISVPYVGRTTLFGLTLICLLAATWTVVHAQARARTSPAAKVPTRARDAANRPGERSRSPARSFKPGSTVTTQIARLNRATTTAALYSPDKRGLAGEYKGVIAYPDGQVAGTAEVVISGNEFTIKTGEGAGETTIVGRIVAVQTGSYTAVAMRVLKADGSVENLSLRLTQVGKKFVLRNVEKEDTQFALTLRCDPPPLCLESLLCKPTCGK